MKMKLAVFLSILMGLLFWIAIINARAPISHNTVLNVQLSYLEDILEILEDLEKSKISSEQAYSQIKSQLSTQKTVDVYKVNLEEEELSKSQQRKISKCLSTLEEIDQYYRLPTSDHLMTPEIKGRLSQIRIHIYEQAHTSDFLIAGRDGRVSLKEEN